MALEPFVAKFGPLNEQRWSTTIPTTGDGRFQKGDVVWNIDADAAETPGWQCVVGGVAGVDAVFKAMAVIAA